MKLYNYEIELVYLNYSAKDYNETKLYKQSIKAEDDEDAIAICKYLLIQELLKQSVDIADIEIICVNIYTTDGVVEYHQ